MNQIPAFYFDKNKLLKQADELAPKFQHAIPFQHVVIDNFLPAEIADLLIREFPGPDDIEWDLHGPGRTARTGNKYIDKLATSDETKFAPFTRHFMQQLNSGTFIKFLERLTGSFGVIADVTYNNCGMHSTGPGGRLMMHTDVNRHPLGLKMHQYLNLLLYLNPDWKDEYGGHLELWDNERKPVHKILPAANRVVIFNTGTRSLHGHPVPLTCPEGRRRNSLAVYYYLRDRPVTQEYEGTQRSVRWIPSLQEDVVYAQNETRKSLDRLAKIRGHAFGIGADSLPVTVPPELLEPGTRNAPIYFIGAHDLKNPLEFAMKYFRAACEGLPGGAAEFLKLYEPIALIGVVSPGPNDSPRVPVLLMDHSGEVMAVDGRDAAELRFIGYIDEMLNAL
ncbi:MAG: 2OG-Fe(II) oxygenase [Planctomycetes bacterium]|nr:2OG-Fe(II) oxygenase [Planctomycetota bacterium]